MKIIERKTIRESAAVSSLKKYSEALIASLNDLEAGILGENGLADAPLPNSEKALDLLYRIRILAEGFQKDKNSMFRIWLRGSLY